MIIYVYNALYLVQTTAEAPVALAVSIKDIYETAAYRFSDRYQLDDCF